MNFLSFDDSELKDLPDAKSLVEKIENSAGVPEITESTIIRFRQLPMYSGVRLVSLCDDTWKPGLRICYLLAPEKDKLYRLNGTSPPIHEVNDKHPINLTAENVFFYLSFFCFFVRGEDGPFYVIHDLSDDLLPTELPDCHMDGNPESKTLRQLFRRPQLFGKDENAKWRCSAIITYGNAIFHGDFLVSPDGMVELVRDHPILSQLPVRLEAPLVD